MPSMNFRIIVKILLALPELWSKKHLRFRSLSAKLGFEE
jgi:hypothetical protein